MITRNILLWFNILCPPLLGLKVDFFITFEVSNRPGIMMIMVNGRICAPKTRQVFSADWDKSAITVRL